MGEISCQTLDFNAVEQTPRLNLGENSLVSENYFYDEANTRHITLFNFPLFCYNF